MIETGVGVRQVAQLHRRRVGRRRQRRPFESRDPATGELVATAPASTVDDLSAAIAAARRAFDETGWPTTAGKERAAILLELARLLREEARPLARARRARDGQADPLRP